MIDRKEVLERADRRARAARERLAGTLVEIQQRLDPQTLMVEAGRELRQRASEWVGDGVDAARRNPATTAAAGAAGIAWLLRKPITRRLLRLFTDSGETPPTTEALNAQAISAAVKRPPVPPLSRSEQHDDQPKRQRSPTRRPSRAKTQGSSGDSA